MKSTVKSSEPVNLIDLSTSSSDSFSDSDVSSSATSGEDLLTNKRSRVSTGDQGGGTTSKKKTKTKKKKKDFHSVLPADFLQPLPKKNSSLPLGIPGNANAEASSSSQIQGCKQFWKAGDYAGTKSADLDFNSGGMDHVRVHPKFLHSNATSHKWVLGAFAELLDNSLDEVSSGATFVKVDMVINRKDSSRMLLIEDNGGGMDPDKVRQCMSLGYSHKSKNADTIGQYGNGFKTSTMRLGADVIVFSRCGGQEGKMPTQSIGLLSYTFLTSTGKEDIVVPLVDYQKGVKGWDRMTRSSTADWHKNLETIIRWSPFASEEDLLRQFSRMKDQGTCIIIYNLWEDDQGTLELDFDADPHDIQIRGVNREEKNIQMGKQFPNSKHFLTYRHSFRSYASILYLRVPPAFRIILRGRDVEHHNIVNDLMMTQEVTYRPNPGTDGVQKDSNVMIVARLNIILSAFRDLHFLIHILFTHGNQMVAVVTIGFVKDAKSHIDVQGFNVYHKNRLIKPFWRLWNPAGSGGRGVIGVLEANFVEPAHDKQGFERTTVLSRLESRLIQMQKTYWTKNSHKIGYVSRNKDEGDGRESSPEYNPGSTPRPKQVSKKSEVHGKISAKDKGKAHMLNKGDDSVQNQRQHQRSRNDLTLLPPPSPLSSRREGGSDDIIPANDYALILRLPDVEDILPVAARPLGSDNSPTVRSTTSSFGNRGTDQDCESNAIPTSVIDLKQGNGELERLREENRQLKERLKRKKDEIIGDYVRDLQLEKNKSKDLEAKLEESNKKILEMNKEQQSLIEIFSEEREQRDTEEEKLREKLKDLQDKLTRLEEQQRVIKRGEPSKKRRK
ncbi:protein MICRORCHIDIA 7 isoform X2 [Impatiens glandulifera]|uniref:protein MICRORCHIDIA 7 isoform X2 n=1 Tax=Impatiens glandulifera TaxID=253017 RepID=UPI001FB0C627|nr:protein MICRORCHIDIA 7 isoform X2 [Impatiens glandulifera]